MTGSARRASLAVVMNALSEVTAKLEQTVEEYIRTLDEYARLKSQALAFLESLRGSSSNRQKELPLKSQFSVSPNRENGGTNTQVIEEVVRSLEKKHFTVHDVQWALKSAGTSLTHDQIGTAFRKLKARTRPPSPMELVKPGRGAQHPPVYRLRSPLLSNQTITTTV